MEDVRVAVSTRRDSETQQERESRLEDMSVREADRLASENQSSGNAGREKIPFLRKGERGLIVQLHVCCLAALLA